MGLNLLINGSVYDASDHNDVAKQAVITCTSGTRPGTPNVGMTIYETDTDRTYQYDGTFWLHMLGPLNWQTPTLLNSWTSASATFYDPAYAWRNSMLYIRGIVSGGTAGSDVFQLPAATGTHPSYRPPSRAIPIPTISSAGIHRFDIQTTGMIDMVSSGTSNVPLTCAVPLDD